MATNQHPDASIASDSDPSPTQPTTVSASSYPPATRRQCGWCRDTFAVARQPGRPRVYCSRSCRQRAHERRRGLGVLPPPDRIITQPGGPLAHQRQRPGRYERGRVRLNTGKSHAMRPSGIADRVDRRLTLCGLLAHATTGEFSGAAVDSCRTCAAVADRRVPARPLRTASELAALRALLDVAAVEMSRRPGSSTRVRRTGQILADLLEAV